MIHTTVTEAALAVPPLLEPVPGGVVTEREGRSATFAYHMLFVGDAFDKLVIVHGLPSEELPEGSCLVRDGTAGGCQPVSVRGFVGTRSDTCTLYHLAGDPDGSVSRGEAQPSRCPTPLAKVAVSLCEERVQ